MNIYCLGAFLLGCVVGFVVTYVRRNIRRNGRSDVLRKGSDELTMTQTYLLHRIQGIRFVELISSEYWPLGWSGDLAQIFSLELKTGDDFKQRVWTCLDVLVRNSGRQ